MSIFWRDAPQALTHDVSPGFRELIKAQLKEIGYDSVAVQL